jgi:serine/threonine protein phosphatase PrpC
VDLDVYGEETTPWTAGEDLLVLFTDGLSDALEVGEIAGQRRVLDEVLNNRALPVGEILRALYDLQSPDGGQPSDDRTAVLVRL